MTEMAVVNYQTQREFFVKNGALTWQGVRKTNI